MNLRMLRTLENVYALQVRHMHPTYDQIGDWDHEIGYREVRLRLGQLRNQGLVEATPDAVEDCLRWKLSTEGEMLLKSLRGETANA